MAVSEKPDKDAVKTAEGGEVSEVASAIVEDLFEHKEFAERLVEHLENFKGGKVVSLRAPWGRGKTDVLLRAHAHAKVRIKNPESPISAVVWVNPWQYGKLDLLSPLLHALVATIPKERLDKERKELTAVLTKLLAATAGATLKAATGLDGAAGLAEKILDGLLKGKEAPGYADPVATVGVAFKELVTRFVASNKEKPQVLIIVDDLDRCLPERQIGLLEAFHFLVDAEAPATFLMAVDGAILSSAAKTHYKDQSFNAHRYLDKIFDFNLDLPQLTATKLKGFSWKVQVEMKNSIKGRQTSRLPERFTDSLQSAILVHPHFRNPRTLTRFLDKLIAYYRSTGDLPGEGEPLDLVLFWLLVTQNWPETRFLIDSAIARGASNPTGSVEEQAVQAVMEFAKSTDAEPFPMLTGSKIIQIGATQATLKQLIDSYIKVTEALAGRGL